MILGNVYFLEVQETVNMNSIFFKEEFHYMLAYIFP